NHSKKFVGSIKNMSNYTHQLLSVNGETILYSDLDRNLIMYNLKTQKVENLNIKGYSPAWSPDGKFIAYQGGDKNCYIMNLSNNEAKLIWQVNSYKGNINLVWSPDSRFILASRLEGGILRWLTAQDNDKETVYYLISTNLNSVRKLGILH